MLAIAATLAIGAALLLLKLRSLQQSNPVTSPLPIVAALNRYIIQQVQQFLDVEAVLQQAEADYCGIYENAIEGIFRSTPEGRYLSINPTLAKMHGYRSPDEMMTMVTDFEKQIYVSPGRRAEFLNLITQQGVVTEFESEVYRKDGSTFWVSENVQIVRDAAGTLYYQGTSLDISDRKQTEIELEALEIKLSTLLSASSSIIAQTHVFLDGTWKCVYFSPNCEKLFGYSPDEFLADSNLWMSRILPEDQEQVVIPIFRDILAGQIATMEFRFRHRDGSIRWISDAVNPRWDANANCWVVTCVETNITAHKQAEATLQADQERAQRERQQANNALRQSEARFRAIFDQIEIGMNLAQLSGTYLQVNSAFCNLVGYSEAELLSMTYQDLTYPEDHELEMPLAAQMQAGDLQTYSLEKRYVQKNGQLRWVNVHVSSVLDSQDNVLFATTMVEDIGDRKQAEAALSASETRFRALTQNSFDIIRLIDHSLTVVYENAASKTILGYSTQGKSLNDCLANIHPGDLSSVQTAIDAVLTHPSTSITVEYRLQRPDCSWVWLESIATNWLHQPDIANIVLNSRDITERKRIEAALRWSEARNRATIIAVPDLLIRMHAIGRYLEVVEGQNVKLLKPETGFDGKNIFDILPPELAEQRMSYVQQALETGQVQVYEQQIEVDGSLYDEEVRIAMINDTEVLVIVRDISDRKRIENERKQSEIERERSQNLLRRQAEREYALNQMTQAIRHSLDLETIFLTATREVSKLLNVDQVSIAEYLPDEGQWHHLAEYLRDASVPSASNTSIPDQNNLIAAQLKQNQIVRIDSANHPADSINQKLTQQFPGAWLLIPLEVEDKVWGSLSLLRTDTQTLWQDGDVDLVSAVADQIAIAIQQSQLYQRVQQLNAHLEQEVQQRTAQLRQALIFEALLKRITDKVRDSLDEDQILQTAVNELGQGLKVECCNAALYDVTLTSHTITHEYSLADTFALGRKMAFADCPTIEIFDQLIQDICLQFCFTGTTYAQPHSEIYTILACPMLDDQGVLGDLWLYRPKHDTFDELEIRLVQQVANQCAISLRQSRLYQTAQLQVQELERLNSLKDDFLNTVSHELRTPMANIKMATQMLEISMEQPTQLDGNDEYTVTSKADCPERYLQILKDECQRETNLINDLLDLSRLDSGLEPLLPLTHRFQYWLPHITESFVQRMQHQQQQLSVTIAEELPPLTTDFNYLEMILTELLHNACKYTPPGEAIVVSAKQLISSSMLNREGVAIAALPEPVLASTGAPVKTSFKTTILGVILSIANSGVTIPSNELKYVFDKFYRVPNNDPWKHGGTGLGLALVKKRVERLNGEIAVSSQDDWTTFTIHLPLYLV
ncbi:PAS domain S-box protein [Phormidium sp. CLA17]|uniref:PAS domain S-box protein n=1 Tax=Leptolyngbya sp. Cla-17 TaxID=2803751 RepID=UPI00182F0272|nr:PAS domain S-box protein [Leptolyngbya sp. Cla-17]MBM0741669.1 PAS domain S-box protein [Leptolyngbya sp. Cla-17]